MIESTTSCSRLLSYDNTTDACARLTSELGRDQVLSSKYERIWEKEEKSCIQVAQKMVCPSRWGSFPCYPFLPDAPATCGSGVLCKVIKELGGEKALRERMRGQGSPRSNRSHTNSKGLNNCKAFDVRLSARTTYTMSKLPML